MHEPKITKHTKVIDESSTIAFQRFVIAVKETARNGFSFQLFALTPG